MNLKIKELEKYSQEDFEKIKLIKDALSESKLVNSSSYLILDSEPLLKKDVVEELVYENKCSQELVKYCPKCNKKFPENENICFDCLVHLKNISDKDIFKIKTKPEFHFKGKNQYNDFEEILSEDNLLKINNFKFTITDYSNIIQNIKLQALKNFDNTIKNNNINFDNLSILDKIILFAKSFTQINYKSSGAELGYFENNTIYIDDRQTQSFQITTLIHELSHFLLNEILACILSKILDSTKTRQTEIVINYILSYIPFAELIDEYCAHNVEGRFTVFGFQDYSSFLQIQKKLENEMTADEIEIIKSIGNTLALSIKDILESLIDESLREEIKELFLQQTVDAPNYYALKMENCQILNNDGLIKSLWMILNDGCEVANLNIDTLRQIE